MSKELTINLDDELYTGLVESVGEKNVSRFIESAVRSQLEKDSSEIYDVKLPLNDGKRKVYLRSPRLADRSLANQLKVEMIEEAKTPRPFGLAKGDFIVPDDFDAPLPEEVLASFER